MKKDSKNYELLNSERQASGKVVVSSIAAKAAGDGSLPFAKIQQSLEFKHRKMVNALIEKIGGRF